MCLRRGKLSIEMPDKDGQSQLMSLALTTKGAHSKTSACPLLYHKVTCGRNDSRDASVVLLHVYHNSNERVCFMRPETALQNMPTMFPNGAERAWKPSLREIVWRFGLVQRVKGNKMVARCKCEQNARTSMVEEVVCSKCST